MGLSDGSKYGLKQKVVTQLHAEAAWRKLTEPIPKPDDAGPVERKIIDLLNGEPEPVPLKKEKEESP